METVHNGTVITTKDNSKTLDCLNFYIWEHLFKYLNVYEVTKSQSLCPPVTTEAAAAYYKRNCNAFELSRSSIAPIAADIACPIVDAVKIILQNVGSFIVSLTADYGSFVDPDIPIIGDYIKTYCSNVQHIHMIGAGANQSVPWKTFVPNLKCLQSARLGNFDQAFNDEVVYLYFRHSVNTLRMLEFYGMCISGECLLKLPKLTTLKLAYNPHIFFKIDNVLEYTEKNKKLVNVELDHRHASLAKLCPNFRFVESLHVRADNFSGKDAAALASLPKLRSLYLNLQMATVSTFDSEFDKLLMLWAQRNGLEELSIKLPSNIHISPQAVQSFGKLRKLKKLRLLNMQYVDHLLFDQLFQSLSTIKSLTHFVIEIYDCNISSLCRHLNSLKHLELLISKLIIDKPIPPLLNLTHLSLNFDRKNENLNKLLLAMATPDNVLTEMVLHLSSDSRIAPDLVKCLSNFRKLSKLHLYTPLTQVEFLYELGTIENLTELKIRCDSFMDPNLRTGLDINGLKKLITQAKNLRIFQIDKCCPDLIAMSQQLRALSPKLSVTMI